MGMIESALSLFLVAKTFHYLEENPEKENLFLAGMFVFGWLAIIYITFKPYPMTYINGVLLVDPQKMMNDGYGDTALLIAFPVARFCEKKWVRFQAAGLSFKGILTGIIGLVPMWLMTDFMKAPLDQALGSHWGHFMFNFILVLYTIVLFPIYVRLLWGESEPGSEL